LDRVLTGVSWIIFSNQLTLILAKNSLEKFATCMTCQMRSLSSLRIVSALLTEN